MWKIQIYHYFDYSVLAKIARKSVHVELINIGTHSQL